MRVGFLVLTLSLASNIVWAQSPTPDGDGNGGTGDDPVRGEPVCVHGVADGMANTNDGHAMADGRITNLKLCATPFLPATGVWTMKASVKFGARVNSDNPFDTFEFRSGLSTGKDGAWNVPVRSGAFMRQGGQLPFTWIQEIRWPDGPGRYYAAANIEARPVGGAWAQEDWDLTPDLILELE